MWTNLSQKGTGDSVKTQNGPERVAQTTRRYTLPASSNK